MPQALDTDEQLGGEEPALITSGDELLHIGAFLGDRASYTARDVIEFLQSGA
jgi:hypothetical protein